jgi:hypothetical protein
MISCGRRRTEDALFLPQKVLSPTTATRWKRLTMSEAWSTHSNPCDAPEQLDELYEQAFDDPFKPEESDWDEDAARIVLLVRPSLQFVEQLRGRSARSELAKAYQPDSQGCRKPIESGDFSSQIEQ